MNDSPDGVRRLIRHGYAPGKYSVVCDDCKIRFEGDKRAHRCRACAENLHAHHEAVPRVNVSRTAAQEAAWMASFDDLPMLREMIAVTKAAPSQEFEAHPALAAHIERMASTGQTGSAAEWGDFLFQINVVLAMARFVISERDRAQEFGTLAALDKAEDLRVGYHETLIARADDQCASISEGSADSRRYALAASIWLRAQANIDMAAKAGPDVEKAT
jgi:hypothetical protein